MNLSSENLDLDGKFHALRRYRAEDADGFVCILDLRRPHRDAATFSPGQMLALAALIAFAVLIVNACLTVQSESASRPADDSTRNTESEVRIIESETAPDFSSDSALPPSPQN